MQDTNNIDLLHLAMIQHHIRELEPEQTAAVYRLALSLRAVLDTEPDIDLAHAALSLISAENLAAGAFQ